VKLTVNYLDGRSPDEVVPTPGDLVRFERHFDIAASSMDPEHPRIEHVMFLAHAALVRTGKFEGTFDEFLDVVGDAEDAPTPSLPPPG
jgi:hypothetical protein